MSVGLQSARALLMGVSSMAMLASGVLSAQAQNAMVLDSITVTATKTEEKVVDSLAPVSAVDRATIQMIDPKRLNELFYNIPGVSSMDRGDSPETAINIRGLQDFGRVAVVIDGARQNYQRTGHNGNGSFFLDPELLAGMDVVRGPTANIYGSGAIGGVVSFRTKDVDDVVEPGKKWGMELGGSVGSNARRGLVSGFTGVRVNPNIDVFTGGTHRLQDNYKDGAGVEIANTANRVSTGIAKVTVRPLDGHEFKFSGIFQEDLYNNGQPTRPGAGNTGTSVYATDLNNYQASARWRYSKPEDRIFNWDANVYWNRTHSDQTKTYHNSAAPSAYCGGGLSGNNITGCVGDKRSYTINTAGFDVHNTSRFDIGGWRNALTVGGDAFQDNVTTADTRGASNVTTPGGERTVSGAFVQLKSSYASWLEIVSAVRYDQYNLKSAGITSSGDRVSPKITVGVTPIAGFTPYVSYAEGYRAPAITETLISGAHPTGGGPQALPCGQGMFCFQPNPSLRPEVGKTKEAGLNLKYDNIFAASDSFRGKFNVFRNDIDDYVELTFFGPVGPYGPTIAQYQNIRKAHIQGFEAEAAYDAGNWFLSMWGSIQRGYNDVTNLGLATVQGNKFGTLAGVRLLDRKLTLAASLVSVASNENVPANYLPSSSYDLLNFYLTYQPMKDVWINFSVDNALDRYYRPFAVPRSTPTDNQNDTLWASAAPGRTFKASMRVRFSAL